MSPTRKPKAPSETPDSAGGDQVTTTFRITKVQWAALRREALELALQRGSGRPDASEALRGILDAWLAQRRR